MKPVSESRKMTVRPLVQFLLMAGIILIFTATAWSSPVDLSGSYTDPDARVVYTVGTEHDDNPAIGLDFWAEGALTYDYNMEYDIISKAETSFIPNTTKTLTSSDISSILTLKDGSTPSLTTTQPVTSGTSFFFGIDTWLTGDFYTETELESFGPVKLTDSGGELNSTGTNYEDKSLDWGPGLGIVSGGSDTLYETVEAPWSVNIDLFSYVDVLRPLDPILDLGLILGMDIVQEENLMALIDYDFDLNPIDISVPDGTLPGVYETTVTGTLAYDLAFQSSYDYEGNASLYFDAPLMEPMPLWTLGSSQFDVGTITNIYSNTIDVEFGMTYEVLNEDLCTFHPVRGWICLDPQPYPAIFPPEEIGDIGPNGSFTIARIDYDPPQGIPEPSTLLLLGSGLIGLAGLRRRFRK